LLYLSLDPQHLSILRFRIQHPLYLIDGELIFAFSKVLKCSDHPCLIVVLRQFYATRYIGFAALEMPTDEVQTGEGTAEVG
jgi:hypothetical protein